MSDVLTSDLAHRADTQSAMVVVAIPSEDDYVWKISSEKIPHLTLLYLGDHEPGPDTTRMAEFVEHVAKTSLRRFGMRVDRRGTLGDQGADVLFFDSDYSVKDLETIRSYLLANDEIAKAYRSAEQYPTWKPHLTLGYPENPAKPDTRDYPGINWVHFDRIAVWVGDFEGPEFLLDDDRGLSMSATQRGAKAVSELWHYGVPGMKWGVRRRSSSSSSSTSTTNTSEDHKKATVALSKPASSLSNQEMQELITRMNLEQQYVRLTSQAPAPVPPTRTAKAAKFVSNLMLEIGREQVTRVAKGQAALKVEQTLKARGQKELADRLKPKKK